MGNSSCELPLGAKPSAPPSSGGLVPESQEILSPCGTTGTPSAHRAEHPPCPCAGRARQCCGFLGKRCKKRYKKNSRSARAIPHAALRRPEAALAPRWTLVGSRRG